MTLGRKVWYYATNKEVHLYRPTSTPIIDHVVSSNDSVLLKESVICGHHHD